MAQFQFPFYFRFLIQGIGSIIDAFEMSVGIFMKPNDLVGMHEARIIHLI